MWAGGPPAVGRSSPDPGGHERLAPGAHLVADHVPRGWGDRLRPPGAHERRCEDGTYGPSPTRPSCSQRAPIASAWRISADYRPAILEGCHPVSDRHEGHRTDGFNLGGERREGVGGPPLPLRRSNAREGCEGKAAPRGDDRPDRRVRRGLAGSVARSRVPVPGASSFPETPAFDGPQTGASATTTPCRHG